MLKPESNTSTRIILEVKRHATEPIHNVRPLFKHRDIADMIVISVFTMVSTFITVKNTICDRKRTRDLTCVTYTLQSSYVSIFCQFFD